MSTQVKVGHTLEPWSFDGRHVCGADGTRICEMFPDATNEQSAMQADAGLIVAAPALLKALISIRGLNAYMHGAGSHSGLIDKISEIAQTAIAKAEALTGSK